MISSPPERKGVSPLDGLLLVRKGKGPSSSQVVQQVRKALGGVKAGHTGTLDPEAEGILPVCLGKGTKLSAFLTGLDKEYEGTMKFGEETDTQDGEGEVLAVRPVAHLTEGKIRKEMQSFIGEILQLPPMFSAVKVDGERLYRRARRGEKVERRPRAIRVAKFDLARWESPFLDFRVLCGSGTYVRTLCRDLAEKCGSAGHMTALTRTAVGPFAVDRAVGVDEIKNIAREGISRLPLLSLSEAVPHLPGLEVTDEEAVSIRHGRPFRHDPARHGGDFKIRERVKLVTGGGELAAVATFRGAGEPLAYERVFGSSGG